MKPRMDKKLCLPYSIFGLTILAFLAGCSGMQPVYRNPVINEIGPADPTVVYHQGNYYLYCSGDNRSYHVYRSADLVHWSKGEKIFIATGSGVWAPDVFYDTASRQYYLYYSFQYTIGVAVSNRPDSKFSDKGILVRNAIDAHMYRDQDGSYYLYYKAIPNSRIVVQKMASPTQTDGDPIDLLHPSQQWEMGDVPIIEAPWLLKHKRTYYLLYSGNGAGTLNYAMGYATSNSPTGPFVKHPANPILRRGGNVYGPGHGSVVTDRGGNLWLVYHQQKDDTQKWNRFICIDRLWFDERGVLHTRPTRGTDQPAPEFPGWFFGFG